MWSRLRRNAGKKHRQSPLGLRVEALEDRLSPAAFTPGNLAILRAGASASNTTATIIELNTTTAGQTPSNIIPIDGTGANSIRISGSATSTGYLSHTNDGTLLTFTGVNSTDTAANANTLNPRAVVTLDPNGAFNIATTYTGASGNQTRSATSLDNTTWYIADQNGLYTNGATAASPTGNFRASKTFGGTVYLGQASSTATTIQVVTISAASGATVTALPGLTNNSSLQDFYLVRSGDNGNTYDVLYVVSATANTAGTIAKYSLVSGSWTANGTYATTFGGFGLAAADNGNGALLYVSTGLGALTSNSLLKLSDTAGYNQTINITTADNVTLYSTTGTTIIKGVDFVPTAAPANQPPAITLPGGAVNYTENDPATVLDSAATVTDADSANFDTGTLTVGFSANGTADDRLAIRNQGTGSGQIGVSGANVTFEGTTIGTFTGGSGTTALVVTFNANATPAAAQALVRNITFANVSDNPSTSARTVRFVVTDGDGGTSAPVEKTVNVAAVNDAPAGANKTITLDEDSTYTFTTTDFGFSDVDGNALAAVKLTTVPTPGTLALSGLAVSAGDFVSAADITAGKLTYRPALNGAGSGYAAFTFQVQDNGGTANNGADLDPTANTITFNVTLVNDPPVITLPGSPATFTENGAPVIIDATATVEDVDNGNFDSGKLTVDITANGTADDRLSVRDQGTGVGQIAFNGTEVRYNSGSGSTIIGGVAGGSGTTPLVVTFNASASVEAVQALVRNITFNNVSEAPSTATRTVRFVVTDDFDAPNNTSAAVSATVNVAAVNDATVVTTSNGATNYTEGNAPVAIDTGLTVSDVDNANLASATVQITEGYVSGQDVLAFVDANGITGSWNAGTATLTLTGSSSVANYQTALQSITYVNNSDDPSTADRTVTFIVNDGNSSSSAATKTVTVAAVNDAPTLSATGGTPTFTENGAAVALFSGAAVSTIEAGQNIDQITLTVTNVADGASEILQVDGTAVALTSGNSVNTAANGFTVSVTLAGSTATVTISKSGGVSTALAADTVNTLAYRNTSENPSTASRVVTLTSVRDTGGGQDTTALSIAATVTVTATNDAPTLNGANNLATINEDPTANPGTLVSPLVSGQVSDPDSTFRGIAITATVTTNGSWEYTVNGGTSWQSVGSVSGTSARLLAADASTRVRFVPNANFNGTVASGLTFRAWDGTSGSAESLVDVSTNGGTTAFSSATASSSITINPVNDEPSITLAATTVTVNEDSGAFTQDGFATLIPGGGSDENGQTALSYLVSNSNPSLFAPGGAPAIAPNGTLTFTPVSNAFGSATITVSVTDSGGTDNDGDNTSQNFTFTTSVTAVNDAPTLNDPTDTTATIASLTTVNLTGISAGGGETQSLTVTATSNNPSAVPNPNVSYTSPNAIGSLSFTPLNSGPATITVRVTDDNGTPGNTADDQFFEQTFLVTVAANQAPITAGPEAAVTNEDTPFAFTGGSSISVTDPDGTPGNITTVASVPVGFGTLTATAGSGGASVSGSGGTTVTFVGSAADVNAALATLVYTPPADANSATLGGTFLLSLSSTDGLGESDSTSVIVTVNPVNDAPSFTLNGNPAGVNEDAGPQTVANFATNIARGPATATDETGQTVTFLVTGNSNPALFAPGGAPAISSNGTLTYTPATNAFGTATITVVLQDSGGGTDTSAAQQFVITVNAASDAPVGIDSTATATEDSEYTFTAADFGFSDPNDSPADAFAGVVIATLPTAGTMRLGAALLTAGQFVSAADLAAGNLRYTPATNSTATVTFTFRVQDTGAAGQNLDPTPNALSVNVTPVNDAPTVTLAAPAIGLNQDFGPFVQDNFATFNPGGGADEAGQTPAYSLTVDNPALFTVLPTIDANGRLTFTPAAGASGSATLTVAVRDSGSNVAPNVSFGATQQFAITVFPSATLAATSRGLSVASSSQVVAFGSDAGAPGLVRVVNPTTGASVRDFFPFGAFSGGLHVAVADVTGDGTDDIIVATASQLAAVAVFDGATGGLVNLYLPFGLFPSGAQVATGDLNGDGRQDIVVGLNSGAPFVVAIDGRTGQVMRAFNAIPGFAGGVRIAVGDVTGDGKADITAIAGPGGSGFTVVYDGATGGVSSAFFVAPGLPGEINLAVGDVTGDGLSELVLGIQVAGGTLIGAFTPSGQLAKGYFIPTTGTAGAPQGATPAAWLATTDVTGDGIADLFVGDPAGSMVTRILVVNGATGAVIRDRAALDPLFGTGL